MQLLFVLPSIKRMGFILSFLFSSDKYLINAEKGPIKSHTYTISNITVFIYHTEKYTMNSEYTNCYLFQANK
ncbi:hypothetical protein B8W99_23050 [Peribacillus simplex]|nr:hypothetical protein B8W99_23050 [Peribacillus simplex]